ncbi:hypothetical protein Tcan_01478 [Toxocara canis]|uniref:Uncharacterized protein n=1 Tax=Toxocara canis TaxID=6265 RepID=A0A0B2VMG5_TOXCA|nr:hypothetical protein Tcan_01478 [Toxocara canis]
MRGLTVIVIAFFAALSLCVRSFPVVRAQRNPSDAEGGKRRFEFIRFGKRFVLENGSPYSNTPHSALIIPQSMERLNGLHSWLSDAVRRVIEETNESSNIIRSFKAEKITLYGTHSNMVSILLPTI